MTTWTDIYGDVDGSPIRGVAAEFRAARSHFLSMRDDAESIVREFSRFRGDGQATGSLEGDAGTAFARFVDEVGGELEEVPRIAGEAHDILDRHVTRLADLRLRAELATDSALARARTAWDRKRELEADADDLRQQLSQVQGRLDDAQADADAATEPDPAADAALDDLNSQHGSLAGSLRDKEQAIEDQADILSGIRDEWDDLRGEEEGLNDETAGDLDGIDLGDLEDPGWFESIVSSVADFVGVVIDIALGPLDELVAAAFSGDWATFFWELKEALDTALMVLAVVALFIPFTAPLVVAMLVLSAVVLAINVGLYSTQTPNPETGETVGLGDVLLSAAGVALAFGGGMQALRAARGLPSSFTMKSGLQALADTGMDVRTVLAGGDDAAAAAQRLGVQILPIPKGTPLSESLPYVLKSNGGPLATYRLLNDLNGAMPPGLGFLPGQTPTIESMLDGAGDGSLLDGLGVDAGARPNPDVFTRIAQRQRFEEPSLWNSPRLPPQVQIIPA